jgi:NAD(P)-dependent dehydrogenase (short-subunit alcohol dehydrogenase family)
MVATETVRAMPAAVLDRLVESLPTGRMVEPAEVAAAVAFLASSDAAQVTGQEIAVEGPGR